MNVAVKNIIKLLKTNFAIKIPFFQRQYVWNWSDQINPLLRDIKNINSDDYYLGNIIFKYETSHKLIIDGQQRITTFLILFSILAYTSFQNIKLLNTIREILEDYDFDSFYISNKDVLMKIIKNETHKIEDSEKNNLYYKNYTEIKDYVYRHLTTEDEMAHFINKLESIKVAEIFVDSSTDENELFSKINSTGVKLTEYDLFKNRILNKLISELKEQNSYIDKQVNEWVRKLDNINNSFEFDKNIPDKLLRAFIGYKTYILCSKSKIYATYKKYESDTKNYFSKSEIVFDDYCKFGTYYKYIFNKEYKKKFSDYDWLFVHPEFETYSTLIVNVLEQFSIIENEKVLIQDRNGILDCLKILEYYIISRKFSPNAQDKTITRTIPLFVKEINELQAIYPNLTYKEALFLIIIYIPIEKSKFKKEEFKYSCPEMHELKTYFERENIYGKNRTFTKNFLMKIAKILDPKDNSKCKSDELLGDKWTIEHVMPKNLDEWIKNGFVPDEENIVDTIGNLTLTKYNSEFSNEIFSTKQAKMKEHEGFILNNYLIEKDNWNNKEIKDRSINVFYKIFSEKWNSKNIIEQILSKYSREDLISFKSSAEYDTKFDNARKNISYFKKENIDVEKLKKLIKSYYINKNGAKAEYEVFGRSYSGWIMNSIKKIIDIDHLHELDIDHFLDRSHNLIVDYLKEIEKKIDEKDI